MKVKDSELRRKIVNDDEAMTKIRKGLSRGDAVIQVEIDGVEVHLQSLGKTPKEDRETYIREAKQRLNFLIEELESGRIYPQDLRPDLIKRFNTVMKGLEAVKAEEERKVRLSKEAYLAISRIKKNARDLNYIQQLVTKDYGHGIKTYKLVWPDEEEEPELFPSPITTYKAQGRTVLKKVNEEPDRKKEEYGFLAMILLLYPIVAFMAVKDNVQDLFQRLRRKIFGVPTNKL